MNVTRRSALKGGTAVAAAIAAGGAVAATVPAVVKTPQGPMRGLPAADESRLETLYQAWQEAEAEFCRVCDIWADLSPQAPRELEDRAWAERRAANERAGDALLALAAVPAASLVGIATKFKAWENDGGSDGTTHAGDEVLESALADLRRMAGGAS